MDPKTKHESPPGFQMHVLANSQDPFQACRLYLPSDLAHGLREREELARKQREEQEIAPPVAAGRVSRPASATFNVHAERAKVRVPDPRWYTGVEHPVYDAYEPVHLLTRSRSMSDKRDVERIETIYKQLSAKGSCLRRIAWPEEIPGELDALAGRLPHFGAVTQFVRQRLEVASANDLPPRIPPILLTGDPGLGKTHYCRALAKVLQTTVRVQSFDNAETTSQLLGSDRHWGNTHHGILFELLALGEHANPIVILDELDKSRSRHGGMDPLAPLHSVLEPSTACALRDISLEFTLDASLVTFIATANDTRRIPETLLSRFRVFEIMQPHGTDAITVAHEILCEMLRRLELPPPATRRLAAALAHLPAREIVKTAEDGLTRMLADGRRELLPTDISADGDQPPAWLH